MGLGGQEQVMKGFLEKRVGAGIRQDVGKGRMEKVFKGGSSKGKTTFIQPINTSLLSTHAGLVVRFQALGMLQYR